MAKKTEQLTSDLRKLLAAEKLVIGTTQTIDGLRAGTLARILVAKNCDQKTKDTLAYYQKIAPLDLVQLDITSEELGVMCKKQFPISVLGVLK